MRTIAAGAVLCAIAISSSALAQTWSDDSGATRDTHHYSHHRTAQDNDWSWRNQRAYVEPAPANAWPSHDGYTRGQGGAGWNPGSANGS
jgi:hypothetical protein